MRAGFLLATCVRSFPAPTGSSAEGKNFSLVTPPGIAVRNSLPAWVNSRIQLGAPGTRNPGAARLRGGGRGRRPPRSRGTTHGPRGRGRGARPGLGRARPPPPQQRRAGIVSSAPAAPCARSPEPTGRAGRLRGGQPSVGPSVRPARPLPSRFPAAVPLACRSGAVSSGSPPQELAGPRRGPRLRRAPPRHLSVERETDGRGEARREKEEADSGRPGVEGVSASQAAAATAPPPRQLGGPRLRGGGGGAASRGGAPTAHSRAKAGASQSARAGSTRPTSAAGGARREAHPLPDRRGPAPAPGSSRPIEASATPADRVSLYGPNWCKEVIRVQPRFAGGRYLFSAAALRQPLMARSGCRKPPPLLAAASSHAWPSWLPAAGAPPRRQSWCWMGGWGGSWPAKFPQDGAFVRGSIGCAPNAAHSLPAPTLFGLASRSVALALVVLPGRVCVYCRERLKHSVNTYGFEASTITLPFLQLLL